MTTTDNASQDEAPRLVRLNKLLADNGIASRRRADQLISDGEVMVDGKIVTELGIKVDPETQRIEWDGVVLRAGGDLLRYYLLNKPTGVVCTNDEKELRRRVWDMITDPEKGRIYPVGRLDVESSGLIILTNDGEFTHKVTHPSFGIEKTYEVKIPGNVADADLERIRKGLHLAEGKTAGARIAVMMRNDHITKVSITLTEGKNRDVRRVFARFGYKVKELHRVTIGPLKDRGLAVGNWRQLGPEEVAAILEAGNKVPTKRPQRPKRKASPYREDTPYRESAREPRQENRVRKADNRPVGRKDRGGSNRDLDPLLKKGEAERRAARTGGRSGARTSGPAKGGAPFGRDSGGRDSGGRGGKGARSNDSKGKDNRGSRGSSKSSDRSNPWGA